MSVKEFFENIPVLLPQECEGNYNFNCNKVMVTKAFMDVFGEDAMRIALISKKMILERYSKPDYLQVFTCKGIRYWCMSSYDDEGNSYILFLLPSDY